MVDEGLGRNAQDDSGLCIDCMLLAMEQTLISWDSQITLPYVDFKRGPLQGSAATDFDAMSHMLVMILDCGFRV